MAKFTAITLAAAALAGVTQAVGTARIHNNCNADVTIWSVGSEVSEPTTLKKGEDYNEKYEYDAVSGGKALKMTKSEDGLYDGSPQTIFSYTIDDRIWYDISTVFGYGWEGSVTKVEGKGSCPDLEIREDGSLKVVNTLKLMTEDCGPNTDVKVTLCAPH